MPNRQPLRFSLAQLTQEATLAVNDAVSSEHLPTETALPGVVYRQMEPITSALGEDATLPIGQTCPSLFPIKGNVNYKGERIFHVAGQKCYDQTKPEQCFSSVEVAADKGFRASLR